MNNNESTEIMQVFVFFFKNRIVQDKMFSSIVCGLTIFIIQCSSLRIINLAICQQEEELCKHKLFKFRYFKKCVMLRIFNILET